MRDTYRVRHAVRDVGAALGMPPGEIDAFAKAFPHIRARDARQALEELPELRSSGLGRLAARGELDGFLTLVEALDGLPRHIALHPCGVLLSDACVDNDLKLMAMPPDLDAAFRKFIPPFGAAGNPVDITGGEPPKTYQNTIRLGLEDERIHSLILGYWHTIVTPPMVFAKLVAEVVAEFKAKGIDKPVVASLAGDVEVEEAAEYLFAHGIPAYPYSTEMPVMVLGAKYQWARGAGLIK